MVSTIFSLKFNNTIFSPLCDVLICASPIEWKKYVYDFVFSMINLKVTEHTCLLINGLLAELNSVSFENVLAAYVCYGRDIVLNVHRFSLLSTLYIYGCD